MKKLDIIIPAYKAQSVIIRALSSIAMQTRREDVTVTIVNDCDGVGYAEAVKAFSPFLDVREISTEANGGPGVARQCGIDQTTSPFFTCMDADDTFYGAFAVEILLKAAEGNPDYHTFVGTFTEEREGLQFINHQQDLIWMFGKVYRRDFVDKWKVRFNETRANEDNGFNTKLRLLSSETEKIMFLSDVVYVWHFKPDSITRVNNCQYSYDQSFVGYADNMIDAIAFARKAKPFNGYIDQWAIQVMAQLYNYYWQTVKRDSRFAEQNMECCRKYHREVFAEVFARIPKETVSDIFAQTFSDQAPNMRDNVPTQTVYQFIDSL